MFRSATLKLTALYLGIIVLICLIFSVALYNALAGDFDRNFQRQQALFYDRPRFQPIASDPELQQLRQSQTSQGKRHILTELVYIDIIFLISGGFASYFLAKHTLKPIEEAHSAQSRFASDASHELRTPLATMQTEIEVALRDPKLKFVETKDLLRSNLEELSSLRRLTDGLLHLARNSEETTPVKAFEISQIITSAVSRTKSQALQKHITIIAQIPKRLEIVGNETNLVELFVILLENAIKYSPENTEVTAKVSSSDEHQVVVEIADHGIGIAKKDLPYIFDRFYRANSARTHNSSGGHGLGLAIAKQIVVRHNGDISAKSQPQKGTSIYVSLPLQ